MTHLSAILAALVPLFGLIVLGTALARAGFPGDDFWPRLERFIYFVLFPALLIEGLATAPLDASRIAPVFIAIITTLGFGSLLIFLSKPLLALDGPGFSSLYQGGIRFNTYLGIAVVIAVFGEAAVAVTALTIALMIPLINVGCVLVLSRYADADSDWRQMLRSLAQNPLIIACVAGLVLNLTGIGLHDWLASGLDIAGSAAVPLGLMSVGAGLQLGRWHSEAAPMLVAGAIKLLILPLAAWWIAGLAGLSTLETQVLVVFAALPTATSAYILARQMGGDHALIARMLTLQTAAAAITLPLILALLASQAG